MASQAEMDYLASKASGVIKDREVLLVTQK